MVRKKRSKRRRKSLSVRTKSKPIRDRVLKMFPGLAKYPLIMKLMKGVL